MVTIYQFEVYRIDSDECLRSRRWGTREAISDIAHGRILEGTATEVDESVISSDIFGFTAHDFSPVRRSGFQNKVER